MELYWILLVTALYGIIKTWRFTNRKVTAFLFWMRNHQLGHVDDVLEHRMHVTGRTVATFLIAAGIAFLTMPWLIHRFWFIEVFAALFWLGCIWHTIKDGLNWVFPEPAQTPPAPPANTH